MRTKCAILLMKKGRKTKMLPLFINLKSRRIYDDYAAVALY